ncbi:MAG TPA: signal peptidase II [Candidatus Nanoarchaeia archaeon]|nr:signal peptidase II [Candidatus Nanoarchaeia archaeon]
MKKYIFLFFPLLIIDLTTKYLIINKEIAINKYFLLNYSQNTGIAFSLLNNQNFLLITLSMIIIIILINFFIKEKKYQLGITFILAGATGNLINRLQYGYVIDFIQIWIWPIFNLADIFNIIGIILILKKSS